MDGSLRFVMMRVLDAEDGGEYGGTAERSRERGVREREECFEPEDSLSDMIQYVWSSRVKGCDIAVQVCCSRLTGGDSCS